MYCNKVQKIWEYQLKRWEVIHKQTAYLTHNGGYTRQDILAMSPYERDATYDYVSSQLEKAYQDAMKK